MTKSTNSKNIILASSSPYRKELLSRVLNDFSCESPDIDETPFPDEEPVEHVARLAEQKAMTVSLNHPDSIIIGSDQICVLDGQILGKPHTEKKAIQQLQACSGKTVIFYTSLCVLESGQQAKTIDVVVTEVSFRVPFSMLKASLPVTCSQENSVGRLPQTIPVDIVKVSLFNGGRSVQSLEKSWKRAPSNPPVRILVCTLILSSYNQLSRPV